MNVKQRKYPRQARASATIYAIVEASIQLLLDRSYVASRPPVQPRDRVSIGSIYQYFPNCTALAAAAIDRCCEDFIATLDLALVGRPRITLAECVHAIVDVILVSTTSYPTLTGS
jgi:AcrR family transcriptional regulator